MSLTCVYIYIYLSLRRLAFPRYPHPQPHPHHHRHPHRNPHPNPHPRRRPHHPHHPGASAGSARALPKGDGDPTPEACWKSIHLGTGRAVLTIVVATVVVVVVIIIIINLSEMALAAEPFLI